MPNIDLSILNQRQTPAFFASSLATRPAFGFAGRIFIDSDVPSTGIYRDTGSAWVQIADQTGSLTGYIQTQTKWFTDPNQRDFTYGVKRFIVANDNPATAGIVPLNTLFINYQNDFTVGTSITGSVGINTDVPTATFDVHSAVSVIQQLNQTTATNNSLLAFQNNNVGLWRIGNFYNAGANDWGVFDVVGAIQPVTVKKTTGQVLIGTSTVGSGKLVVASSTGDNGVQIVGASAPSLRIDNAESGPTKRAGFGISTATNNFIQGSADRDFCMFNGSTTASPILFGIYDTTNVAEAARISAARNLLIGTTTDAGQKLQVNGTSYLIGNVGMGVSNALVPLHVETTGTATTMGSNVAATFRSQAAGRAITFQLSDNTNSNFISSLTGAIGFGTGSTEFMRLASSSGNLLINTIIDAGQKLQVNGTSKFTGNLDATGLRLNGSDTANTIYAGSSNMAITAETGYNISIGRASDVTRSININTTDGYLLIGTTTVGSSKLKIVGLPTSPAGLSSGDVYSNLGILTIV